MFEHLGLLATDSSCLNLFGCKQSSSHKTSDRTFIIGLLLLGLSLRLQEASSCIMDESALERYFDKFITNVSFHLFSRWFKNQISKLPHFRPENQKWRKFPVSNCLFVYALCQIFIVTYSRENSDSLLLMISKDEASSSNTCECL